MADVNIEVAHMRAGELFGDEQLHGIAIYKQVVKELKREKKSFVTSALIDDKTKKKFNEKAFIANLKKNKVTLDFIGYESALGKKPSTLWTFARLGEQEPAITKFTKKPFGAKEIITILPEKYSFEERGVLMAVKKAYPKREKDMSYEFFKE